MCCVLSTEHITRNSLASRPFYTYDGVMKILGPNKKDSKRNSDVCLFKKWVGPRILQEPSHNKNYGFFNLIFATYVTLSKAKYEWLRKKRDSEV